MPEAMTKDSNRTRLTWICYLCYFFTGSLVTVSGMMLGPIAKTYGVSPGSISYVFTLQNGLMFIIILVGGFMMQKISLKKLFLLAIIVEFIAMGILQIFVSMPFSFAIFMAVVGFSGGIFMALASFLIVRIYSDPVARSTRLVMADFFFSFSGVVMPMLAGQLLQYHVFWIVIYYVISIVGLVILFMVVASKFPDVVADSRDNAELYTEKWGAPVYLISISCFFFIMGELVFAQWLPLYLQRYMNVSEGRSGMYESLFWGFMAIGLFVGRFVMKKFRLGNFIIGTFGLATLFMIIIALVPNELVIAIAIIFCGFFNSVVYASMLAYGSLQVKHNPPTLIAFILAIGTLGTMASSPVSGYLANNMSIHAAFASCFILYIIGFIFFLLCRSCSKAEKIHGELRGEG